jgi:hypothetical protein
MHDDAHGNSYNPVPITGFPALTDAVNADSIIKLKTLKLSFLMFVSK